MKVTIDTQKLQVLLVEKLLEQGEKTSLAPKDPVTALRTGKASRAVVESIAKLLGCGPEEFSDLAKPYQTRKGRPGSPIVKIDKNKLRGLIKQAGYTSSNLPGISASALHRIMKTGQSTLKTTHTLAEFLKCSVADFMASPSLRKPRGNLRANSL
jgi:hypothetical protein